jgi:hypothetical protein
MNESDQSYNSEEKTRPWDDDEFLFVNNIPYIYDTDGKAFTVLLPGGVKTSIDNLIDDRIKQTNRTVRICYPKRIRITEKQQKDTGNAQ